MVTVYKVVSAPAWRVAEGAGAFTGSPVDLADGYIHFSTAAQVRETVARHFCGVNDLLIVSVDGDRIADQLRWEPSRGGALFPHLYGPLPMAGVRWVAVLPLGPDGIHLFPELE